MNFDDKQFAGKSRNTVPDSASVDDLRTTNVKSGNKDFVGVCWNMNTEIMMIEGHIIENSIF